MGQKTVKFNEEGISNLPDDKPAVYKIINSNGNNNYTGVAQRGRVSERIMEHLGERNSVMTYLSCLRNLKEI